MVLALKTKDLSIYHSNDTYDIQRETLYNGIIIYTSTSLDDVTVGIQYPIMVSCQTKPI
jgi:hypothetical protein